MHSNAFIHQIISTLRCHVKVLTIGDLVTGTALLKLHRCTCTPSAELKLYSDLGLPLTVYFCFYLFIYVLESPIRLPRQICNQGPPSLLPPSSLSVFHSSSGFFPVSIWPRTYYPFIPPPFFTSSLPAACRTLTARCVYHPLSGRGITSHGRLAG